VDADRAREDKVSSMRQGLEEVDHVRPLVLIFSSSSFYFVRRVVIHCAPVIDNDVNSKLVFQSNSEILSMKC